MRSKLDARRIVAYLMIAALSGCTSLTSYTADDPAVWDGNVPKPGMVPYSLGRTILNLNTTYVLMNCTPIAVNASASVNITTEQDANFYLDTSGFETGGPFKSSGLKVDRYSNGMLQGINATVSDQTGAVLAAAFTAALSAATFVAKETGPFAVQRVPKPTQKPQAECTPAVKAALVTFTTDQKTLTAALAAAAAKPDPNATANIASLQASVANDLKPLTITGANRIDFQPANFAKDAVSGIIRAKPQQPFASPINRWFTAAPQFTGLVDPSTVDFIAIVGSLPTDAKSTIASSSAPNVSHPIAGVVYRVPASVRMMVCFGTCPDPTGLQFSNNIAWSQSGILISQLGTVAVAPLSNHLFVDTGLTFAQDTSGAVTSVESKKTSTLATFFSTIGQAFTSQETAATNATSANAAAVTAKANALNTQATAATTNAGLNDVILTKQADCLNQQKTILQAGGTPKVSCN